MAYALPLSAAVGCAICNGVAAVLQKESADREPTASSLKLGLLLRLLRNMPYIAGTVLDLLAGICVLIAVHSLPLFLVQSVISSGIVITFIIERYHTHTQASYRLYMAIVVVLAGLSMLALSASPQTIHHVHPTTRLLVTLAPLPLALLGTLCTRIKGRVGTASLAILAGISFGGSSIAGRILLFKPPLWHIVTNPLLYVFITFGVLGLLLFSVGLQRTSATALNTLMTASETLVPSLVGVIWFGDTVRHGYQLLAIVGVAITLSGITFVSTIVHHQLETKH